MPLERDSTEAKCDKKEKGRFKKLAKKIQKAALAANNNAMDSNEKVGLKVKTNGISSYKEIKECIRMGLKVSPVVLLRKYLSREACNYDVTLGELRELLLSILQDKPPPRLFEIKNRFCIRGVICLHVLNFDNGEYSVRVSSRKSNPSSQTNEDELELSAAFLPYRLLTLAANDIEVANTAQLSAELSSVAENERGTAISAAVSLQSYALSPAMMRLWGYPTHPTDFNPSEDVSGSGRNSLKRKREDLNKVKEADPIIGLKKGSLPTAEEARDCLSTLDCHCFQPIISDIRKPMQSKLPGGTQEEVPGDFLPTFPSSSAEYDSLWPIGAARTGYPLPVASVDCEMCATLNCEASLIRLSVLDVEGCVVLDTLVKPSEPIVDYKTAYSGISEKDLADVTVTLDQARLAFLRLVSSETILIGHSLESDLIALRLSHRKNCVDTAHIYPHPLGFPRRLKLRQLAKDFLQMQIQRGNNGHDSTEDARAALQLALLKAENGPLFGVYGRKGMADARIPLLEQVDPQSVSAAALFWQSSSRVAPAAVGSSAMAEPIDSCGSHGTEEIVDGGKIGLKSDECLVPRYVMERCIGGRAVAHRSLNDCAVTVGAACAFLSERRLQWQREDSSDDVTELQRKDFCHITVQLDGSMGTAPGSSAGDKRGELAAVVQRLRESVSLGPGGAGGGGGGDRVVLMVTSQPGLGRLEQLLAARQRCMTHPMSSLVWNQDKERELAEVTKAVAMGHLSMQVI